MSAPVAAAGIGVAGQALFGGGGGTTSATPGDLQGMRKQQIALLNYLLFGQGGGATSGGQGAPAMQRPGTGAGAGNTPFNIDANAGGGGGAGGRGAIDFGAGGADAGARLASFFGGLGSPTTGLQQQATDAIGHTLAADPTAQAQAYLNNLLGQKPGQGIIDAAQPGFDRNLSLANQQGARFGSNNAILRSQAVNDFNVLSANAASQGIQQQLAAAQGLGTLANDQFGRQVGAYGVGQAGAQQADLETQRRLQILLQLLGTAQSASLGGPVQQSGNFLSNAAGTASSLLPLFQMFGGGAKG